MFTNGLHNIIEVYYPYMAMLISGMAGNLMIAGPATKRFHTLYVPILLWY